MKEVVVAAIRRHSIDMDKWDGTRLWDQGDSKLKKKFSLACALDRGELPIVYSYVDCRELDPYLELCIVSAELRETPAPTRRHPTQA